MQAIPLVQTSDRNVNQLQQNLSQAINPLIQNPLTNGTILSKINLVSGINTINHGLNRALQGWFFTLKNSAANVYDTQSTNPTPDKTLILVSDAVSVVSIYVF